MRSIGLRLLAALGFVLLILGTPAQAYDDAQLASAERGSQYLLTDLRRIQNVMQEEGVTDEVLAEQRKALEEVQNKAKLEATAVARPLDEVNRALTELGPAPAGDQIETPTIAAQRVLLRDQVARLTAVQKQYALVQLEAEQAQSRLTAEQRSRFLQRIFKSDRSILNPKLWLATIGGSGELWSRAWRHFGEGLSTAAATANYFALLIFPIGILLLGSGFLALTKLASRFGFEPRSKGTETESGLVRLWRVLWGMAKIAALYFVAATLMVVAVDAAGLLTSGVQTVIEALFSAIAPVVFQGGLIYLVAAPRHPERRLVAIDNQAARTLTLIVAVAAFVYGFGDRISNIAALLNLPVSFAIGQSAFTALSLIILIGLGLVILRRQADKGLEDSQAPFFLTWYLHVIPLFWVLLAASVAALVLGFIALSYFVVGNLLDTAVLIIFLGVLHAFVDALVKAVLDAQSRSGRSLRKLSGWSDVTISRVMIIFRTVSDAMLVLFGLVSLIALWTVVLFDFSGALYAASQGIKLGNITLSPWTLAVALLVLTLGILATRLITRWLERRVLVDTQLDKGVQASLRAAAGYTGYFLAGMFALSAAGLEFSSLAIVAGALGVGIGFGLQSIVNNFVSGLILLAERPVRIGDWIVSSAGEGIVKKINVRSTEIETFDNCTIIVPNSNLITEPVRNWTHRDTMGRFAVNVSFVHGTDATHVENVLLKLAQNHNRVMRHPAPTVHLSRITPAGLEFDLRGHTLDVFEAVNIASELRVEVTRSFPKKSMIIPTFVSNAPVR